MHGNYGSLENGSRGGRASTLFAFQEEDPGSMPGAGSHIINIFIVYVHRSHHRPTDGDVNIMTWNSLYSAERSLTSNSSSSLET